MLRRSIPLFILLGCLGCSRAKPIEHPSTVYVLRGWTGKLSPGLEELVQELNDVGASAQVCNHDEWRAIADTIRAQATQEAQPQQPVILIGHSYGADDAVRIARSVPDTTIDLLIALEANSPPPVPANVKRCVNLYRSNGALDAVPIFRGIAMKSEPSATGELVNIDLRGRQNVDHFSITKDLWTRDLVLDEVSRTLKACPTTRPH